MIEAKGRNGYFKVDQIDVWAITRAQPPEIHIEIYSKRRKGNCAPARIQGSEEEVRNLIGLLYDAIIKNQTHDAGGMVKIINVGTDRMQIVGPPQSITP